MITKDMPIIEAVKMINDYVDKAEEFYIMYLATKFNLIAL
jgi:hypothetical protein